MSRRNWRKPTYWRWFWHERVSVEVKALGGVVLLALMLGGGWVAADRLSTAGAGVDAPCLHGRDDGAEDHHGAREGKARPQARAGGEEGLLRPRTAFLTQTAVRTNVVTVSGGVRTVRSRVVVHVPVVSKKVITVNGKTKTLVTTRLLRTTAVETQMHTLTQVQTQVQTETQTQVQVQVQTQTVVSTATRTVTQPVTTTVPVTVTETATVPVTVTQTVTVAG